MGDAPGLAGDLCVDVEDCVGAVPDIEPFETMAEGVPCHALEQEQWFPGVDVQFPRQVRV